MSDVVFPIKFELCDWSETLTYEQLISTANAVSLYLSNEYVNKNTNKSVKIKMDKWLDKNSLEKFLSTISNIERATNEVRMLNSIGLLKHISQRRDH